MFTIVPGYTYHRDALHAFYAAHPDVENADGETLLTLPEPLTDKLDELLLATTHEKAINEHVAQCRPCREFGFAVTHLSNGTVRCDHGSEDGWDGVRYDNIDAG